MYVIPINYATLHNKRDAQKVANTINREESKLPSNERETCKLIKTDGGYVVATYTANDDFISYL